MPLSFFVLVSGVASTLVCLFLGWQHQTAYLVLLPITYTLVALTLPLPIKLAKFRLGVGVFMAVAFVRYIVVPALICISDYADIPLIREPSGDAMAIAVTIMVFELALSCLVIQILSPHLYLAAPASPSSDFRAPGKAGLIVLCVCAIFIVALNPSVIDRYSFFSSTEIWTASASRPALSGGVVIIVDMLLVIPPLLVLLAMHKRYGVNPRLRYVLFAIVTLLPFLMIIKGVSRFSMVVPALAWTLMFIKLFPAYRKRALFTIGAVSFLSVISVTAQKNFSNTEPAFEENNLPYLAWLGNAYFSGPFNMAYAVEVAPSVDHHGAEKVFLNDMIGNLAIISSFADQANTSSDFFNRHIYGSSFQSDQIIPITGQFSLYVGLFLSPVLLLFTIVLMLYFDSKMLKETRIEFSFVYALATIHLALCMMLSFNSIYPVFFNFLMPLYLILLFNRSFVSPFIRRLRG